MKKNLLGLLSITMIYSCAYPITSVTNMTEKENLSDGFKTQAVNRRIIDFSGYKWLVRNTTGLQGPGPNYFSNSTQNVFVDSEGQLHLKITKRKGKWYCASIGNLTSLGYGTYRFYIASKIDTIDKNSVVGLFTWDDDPAYHNREIDIEFSKWGNESSSFNSQYVVQPWENEANINRFTTNLDSGNYSTHRFTWSPDKISFLSVYGHYDFLVDQNYLINSWDYQGSDIPLKGNEKIAVNLWNFQGKAPAQEVELIIKRFEFVPSIY